MRAGKVGLGLVFVAGAAVAAFAQSSEQVVKLPNEIEFKAPLRAGGPQAAVIYGDPNKPGLYVVRVKFSAGQKNLPHFHPDERTVVVLAGNFYWAYGEQWDDAQLKALPPGTFITEPPKVPHYNWAKDGEVILQITGYGPTGALNIPQKSQ
jgi:quercetin dioxygenase-like cupin family protein